MFGKKKKPSKEGVEVKNKEVGEQEKKATQDKSEKEGKTKKKKQKEATGSRFAALILLIVTVVLSLYFYFSNNQTEIKRVDTNVGNTEDSFQNQGNGARFELR
jgi:uncharacterized membrane protein YvbJ